MAQRKVSKGKCTLCGQSFSKAVMTRHLATCLEKAAPAAPPAGRGTKKVPVFHLVIAGSYQPAYWLHVEVPAKATLGDLDLFLRRTWLECCGHMSKFAIDGTDYVSGEEDEDGISADLAEFDDRSMDVELDKVLSPGLTFTHEYDFGSTTYLTLKVVAKGEAEVKGREIRLLARNDPPEILCEQCGKPATDVCLESDDGDALGLCRKCLKKSELDEEGCLPVVNSPRMGVCGYCGPENVWSAAE